MNKEQKGYNEAIEDVSKYLKEGTSTTKTLYLMTDDEEYLKNMELLMNLNIVIKQMKGSKK
jgi:hypothetical protein